MKIRDNVCTVVGRGRGASFIPSIFETDRFENSLLVRVLVSLCPLCDAVQHGIVFGWGVLGFPFV